MIIYNMDYLFLYVYFKYQKWGEAKLSGVYAVCLITIFEIINLFTIGLFFLIFHIYDFTKIENKYFIIIYFLLLGINYLYIYKIKGFKTIVEKYRDENKQISGKRYMYIYTILSSIIFLCFFIYYLYLQK